VPALGEGQRLGHLTAAGEDFAEQLVAEGGHNGADLVGGDDVAVELVGVVGGEDRSRARLWVQTIGKTAREGHTLPLGLDDTGGLTVHVQQIISKTMARLEWKLSHHHPARGADIDRIRITNMPARSTQKLIDGLAGFLLGIGHG